jgi:hypothetical protein
LATGRFEEAFRTREFLKGTIQRSKDIVKSVVFLHGGSARDSRAMQN